MWALFLCFAVFGSLESYSTPTRKAHFILRLFGIPDRGLGNFHRALGYLVDLGTVRQNMKTPVSYYYSGVHRG